MNLSPRPRLSPLWKAVKHRTYLVFVIFYGSTVAGLWAWFMLVLTGYDVTEAGFDAVIVACTAGILFTVLALWGIRYHREIPAERPVILPKPVQDEPTPPHYPRLDDGYQAIAELPPVYLPPIPKKKLRMIFISLKRDGDLALSVDKLKKAARANEKEVAVIREWFKRKELTEDYRAGVRLIGSWREEIDRYLPYCVEVKGK